MKLRTIRHSFQLKSPKCSGEEMEFEPLVTIAIPTFSRYEQLHFCLENILKQDYTNLEILIGDNTANQETPGWLRDCVSRDTRVRYVKHDVNIGMVANNTFVRHGALGTYVCVLHDDDEIPTNYVSTLMHLLRTDPNCSLAGPICDRYFEGSYWHQYEIYNSAGMSQTQRLTDLIKRAFSNPWSFEHLMYGIYRKDSLPQEFTFERWRSIILFFYLLSVRGSIRTIPEVVMKKNTSKSDFEKYAAASYVRRYKAIAIVAQGRLEQRLTALWRIVRFTFVSPHISILNRVYLCLFALKTFAANKEEFSYPPPQNVN